jgi:hypothetical protein
MNVGDLVYYIDRHYIVTDHINGKKWSLHSVSNKDPYKTVTLSKTEVYRQMINGSFWVVSTLSQRHA